MAYYLSTAGVILLEYYQLIDAIELELQTIHREVIVSISLNLHH